MSWKKQEYLDSSIALRTMGPSFLKLLSNLFKLANM